MPNEPRAQTLLPSIISPDAGKPSTVVQRLLPPERWPIPGLRETNMFQKKEAPAPPASRGVFEPTLGTDTVIGTGVQIKGDFKAPANVELRGTVEGNLEVDGLFAIRESGRLIGSVTASDVVVEGEVEGEIAATEKVEISSTGRVQGDVQAKVVCIADGAFLQGKVQMANGESAASKNKKDVAYATAGAALR